MTITTFTEAIRAARICRDNCFEAVAADDLEDIEVRQAWNDIVEGLENGDLESVWNVIHHADTLAMRSVMAFISEELYRWLIARRKATQS